MHDLVPMVDTVASLLGRSAWRRFRGLAVSGPTLIDCATDRNNNYNLIRMIAASSVLVSHSYPIAVGPETIQPLKATFGFTLGSAAVAWFFILSGFLISQSFERRTSLLEFTLARALRLLPGLLCVTAVTAFVLGPIATSLPLADYFTSLETYTYVPRNLTLARLQYPLPGVFAGNPYGPAINGSLWTLVYEVACYAVLALVGLVGLFASRRVALAALLGYIILYLAIKWGEPCLHPKLVTLGTLSLPFAMGMGVYLLRRVLVLNRFWLAVAAGLVAVSGLSACAFEIFCIGSAYIIFYAGYRVGGIMRSYNRLGDYSYGTYIYAFPVQQTLMAAFGAMTPASNAILAFPITLLLAAVSWHIIEHRALRARRALAQRARQLIGTPG